MTTNLWIQLLTSEPVSTFVVVACFAGYAVHWTRAYNRRAHALWQRASALRDRLWALAVDGQLGQHEPLFRELDETLAYFDTALLPLAWTCYRARFERVSQSVKEMADLAGRPAPVLQLVLDVVYLLWDTERSLTDPLAKVLIRTAVLRHRVDKHARTTTAVARLFCIPRNDVLRAQRASADPHAMAA